MRRINLLLSVGVTLSLIGISFKLFAAVPFGDKFDRQQQPGYQGGHVFRPGEQVRATFTTSKCEGRMSMTVAEANGGVGDIRQADTFQLIDVPASEAAKLRDWQGMSFVGVVEIVSSIDQGFVISNMYNYRAKLISLESPKSALNPSPKEIDKMEPGTEIILFGKVVDLEYSEEEAREGFLGALGMKKLARKLIVLKSPKHSYTITLWSGVPMIDGDKSGIIKNLNGNERVEVGDEVQLKVYRAKEGGIATHWCRSCNLEYPSERRKSTYLAERQQASRLIGEMKVAVENKNWTEARKAHGQFMQLQLTPTEKVRHEKLWLAMPEVERPILKHESRYVAEALNKMFDTNIDQMTVSEFLGFCHRWARMEVKKIPSDFEKNGRDESYLYRVLEEIQSVSKSEMYKIARVGAETRLAHFIAKSEQGLVYEHKIDWDQRYNLERNLVQTALANNADSVAFVIDMLRRIVLLEKEGWGYNEEFIGDAVRALEAAASKALRSTTADGRDALAQLILQKGDIQTIYNILQNIPTDHPHTGETIVVGMKAPPKPTPRQRRSQFSYQLQTLQKILDSI